jgi:hypothetical protein
MTTYDWAMCDKDTGNIEYILSVNSNDAYTEAGFYNNLRTFAIESGADHVKAIDETYYDYDSSTFKSRSKQPTKYYKWISTKEWQVDTTTLMEEFRLERDEKLYQCDWTQIADAPLTDEKKAEWVTYRQSLRDTTKNLPEDFDTLDGFAWPTKPS